MKTINPPVLRSCGFCFTLPSEGSRSEPRRAHAGRAELESSVDLPIAPPRKFVPHFRPSPERVKKEV